MSVLTAPEIILRPVISEKSIDESGRGKYTFAVHDRANKIQIKAAIEELYKLAGGGASTSKSRCEWADEHWIDRPQGRHDPGLPGRRHDGRRLRRRDPAQHGDAAAHARPRRLHGRPVRHGRVDQALEARGRPAQGPARRSRRSASSGSTTSTPTKSVRRSTWPISSRPATRST